jgi:hypothetical protein
MNLIYFFVDLSFDKIPNFSYWIDILYRVGYYNSAPDFGFVQGGGRLKGTDPKNTNRYFQWGHLCMRRRLRLRMEQKKCHRKFQVYKPCVPQESRPFRFLLCEKYRL